MITIDLDRLELDENTTAGGRIRVGFPFHSTAGARSSAAVEFELGTGAERATHTDSAEEVLLVLTGEAEARVGAELAPLSAGRLAIVPDGPQVMVVGGPEPIAVPLANALGASA